MTSKIVITDCTPRLMKISLSYLLQNEAEFSPGDADRAVFAIAKGERVEFDIADEQASGFIEEAKVLGVTALVQSATDEVPKTP